MFLNAPDSRMFGSLQWIMSEGAALSFIRGCKKGSDVTFSAERLHYDEITLKGIFHFTPQEVTKAFHLLKDNTIDVKQLITATCSLKEIPTIFPLLAKGRD